MSFTQYDLGLLDRGQLVEVSLQGSAANVRLMDAANFRNYRDGGRHHYFGGLIKASPFRVTVPHTGTWFVTVDMAGLRGTVRSSVRVVR